MTSQDTIQHSRTRLRRILAVSGALLLTLAALAGIVVAGAIVTSRSIHRSAPTYSAGASSPNSVVASISGWVATSSARWFGK